MKKIKNIKLILFLAVIILVNIPIATVYATAGQWSVNGSSLFYNDGYVGIGNSIPNDPLAIKNVSDSQLYISGQGKMLVGDDAGSWWIDGNTLTGGGNGDNHIVSNGYLERGTWKRRDYTKETWFISTSNTADNKGFYRIYHSSADGNKVATDITPLFEIASNGSVFVKNLIVEQSGWPDYVFSKDYNLKPLLEVDKYIKQNKHLPDMPSEEDIKKNGLSVGDMQNKQQEKIEELTLYTIDLQKQVNELRNELNTLRK